MEITEIERRLDHLFPTKGMKETLSMEDPVIADLIEAIHEWWYHLPGPLQRKIDLIQDNMCKREPFALRIIPLFSEEEDIAELFGLD
jgi:hypothetical protein